MHPAVTFDAWHSTSCLAHSRPQVSAWLVYQFLRMCIPFTRTSSSWKLSTPRVEQSRTPTIFTGTEGENTADFLCKASISSRTVCLSLVRWSVPLQADFREPASHVSSWKGPSLWWKLMLPSQSCASLVTDNILYYLCEKNINWYAYTKAHLY